MIITFACLFLHYFIVMHQNIFAFFCSLNGIKISRVHLIYYPAASKTICDHLFLLGNLKHTKRTQERKISHLHYYYKVLVIALFTFSRHIYNNNNFELKNKKSINFTFINQLTVQIINFIKDHKLNDVITTQKYTQAHKLHSV